MPQRGGLVSVTLSPRDLARLDGLAAAIRATGDKELGRELTSGLRRAVTPMRREFKRGALGFLPYRGGLAEEVSGGMRFRTSVRIGSSPRLRISASLPGHNLRAMNTGRIRHPVYGHRDRWATTQARRGWWEDTSVIAGQDVTAELVKAIDTVIAKLKAKV